MCIRDSYKDDGEGSPEEIIAEYDRLSPVFDGATGQAAEYKDQFDKCFGLSGVASCENLEAMFKEKICLLYTSLPQRMALEGGVLLQRSAGRSALCRQRHCDDGSLHPLIRRLRRWPV